MVPQLVEISVTPPTRLRYISRKLGTWFLGVLKGTAMSVTATGHAEPQSPLGRGCWRWKRWCWCLTGLCHEERLQFAPAAS